MLHKATESSAASKKLKENPNHQAREIINEYKMVFYGDSFFEYVSGKYSILSDNDMRHIINNQIGDDYRKSKFNEIYECILSKCQVKQMNIKNGVNVLNGIFDFNSETLIPHSSDYLFTTQIQAKYNPDEKCDRWLGFLNEMLGDDPAKIDILQEYAGYSLNPNINIEMILFLLGRGANGKSVFCEALKKVIGAGNYDTISLDDLKNKNYIAELLGKLINISTESQAKAEVYESNLKRLASGEEIKVDRKYKHPFNFKSNCKHIYSLNALPRVGDKTDAFFRRVLTIPFNRQVNKDKRIFDLGKIIASEEASGILNWMIEGYYRLRDNKWTFTRSQQVEDLLDSYRKDNNNVLNFVEECCEFRDNFFMSNESSYSKYQEWCKESGVNAIKKKSFIQEIVDNFGHNEGYGSKGYGVYRDKVNGSRGLSGIGLLPLGSEPF